MVVDEEQIREELANLNQELTHPALTPQAEAFFQGIKKTLLWLLNKQSEPLVIPGCGVIQPPE